MTPDDLKFLADLLRRRSGLSLAADKAYLVESRLTPLSRQLGHASLGAFIAALRQAPDEAVLRSVTEAMTTNESFFFRDKTPFDQLQASVLPRLIAARSETRRIRVWCAAASTGQEPYSLAILLKERFDQLPGWSFEILATDIASHVLARARQGLYSQFEVQRGLPIQMLVKHFDKVGENWQIKEGLRRCVQFREFNLLDPFVGLGRFDLIFCRNVLIYFDRETKSAVLEKIRGVLAGDGHLVLGAAETVLGITARFEPAGDLRGYYRSSDAATDPARSPEKIAATG